MVSRNPGSEDSSRRILIVQSDAAVAAMMEASLRSTGLASFDWEILPSLGSLRAAEFTEVDLVLCDRVVNDGTWREALAFVREIEAAIGLVVTGPASDARAAVDSIRAGAVDYVPTTERELRTLALVVEKGLAQQAMRRENQRLHHDLSRSLGEVETKNRQLESVIQQLETMARTDELTGLANRRWLNIMLAGAWAEATRHDLPLGFIMIDLDGFKPLNDAAGHPIGDEVLRKVGQVITANCRDVDVCARYGGDEFSVLLPHTGPSETLAVARRVHREFAMMLETLADVEGADRLGMSIGVAHVDLSRPATEAELVKHADDALYASKDAGKHRITVRNRSGVFSEVG